MQHTLKKEKPSLVIPREHGVWAMFLAPFLLGVMLSDANLMHVLAGVGLLSGFIAINALLDLLRRPKNKQSVKRTIFLFGGAAGISLAYPLFQRWEAFWPMLLMGGFLLAPIWFIRHKCERHFLNDLIGIAGLTMLLPLSAGLGGGTAQQEIGAAMIGNMLYFTGSIFFVKSVFREKNNIQFHFLGITYHLMVVFLPFLLQFSPAISLMFLPGLLKMAAAMRGIRLLPKTVGIIEIANVIWFLGWGGWIYLG